MSSDHDVLWILSLNAFAHELGIPVPLTPTALAAGAAVALQGVSPLAIIVSFVAASLLGNAVWYCAGRRYGSGVLRFACRVSLSRAGCATRAESAFRRWGGSSLVIGRFVPGVSLLAPPLAGALGMPLAKFIALSVAGASLWASAFIGAGIVFADEVHALLQRLPALG